MTEPTRQSGGGGAHSSFDRVVNAIEARGLTTASRRQHSLMAGCPVHDERTPSLHITWRGGPRGGGVLLYCHGCQAQAEQIVEALSLTMSDLFDEPLPERDRSLYRVGKSPSRRRAGQRRGKLGRLPSLLPKPPAAPVPAVEHHWVEIERYPYVDHEDRLVQEVIREECTAEGERHKQFRQLFVTRDGRRVKRKPEEFYPVIYRAPQVAAAVKAGSEVWLLEGEKDVHTAERLGLVATTNTQGGKSFPADLVEEFTNARVVVVLDRDSTGWARGVDLHAKLTGVGAKVLLRLPDLEDAKTDFTDHIEAGKGLDALQWVAVEEVAVWHELTSVKDRARSLQQAIEEAQGRWELADEGQDVEDNRRFAKRWALESQVRQESLRDLVDQLCAAGMRIGTEWVGEAIEAAEALLAEGTEAARRCHLQVQVPVPESLRPAAQPPADSPAPADGEPTPKASPTDVVTDDSDWLGQKGVGSGNTPFRVLDGKIVQWEPDRSSRRQRDEWDEDQDEPGKFKTLLSMVVRVSCREYLEVEHNHDVEDTELMGRSTPTKRRVSAPKTLIAVRLQYPDEITGELLEIRVMADKWRDHSWLESLPGPPDYDHKRAGLDQLQRAILAISENVVDEVLYRATGWRENADGTHRFIHRRGAITPTGHEDVEVAFSGPIERYNFPDPIREAKALRTAWQNGSATMLDRLPGRVAAPLLGQVFRAVLGHNPWVLTLVGPPGSYKTSVAAKAMQHFGEKWEHKKPASSMSGNGDTFNALRFKLHNAKDCLYWMDDFAPTRSWLEAQKHLEETARLIHNQEERSRSSRDGLSVSDGTGPRASGLCTSEVMPRPGSGAERMLVVPLAREDVDTALLFPLDEALSRHQRALVMASYISWLSGDLMGKRAHYMEIADAYADALVERAGESVRQAAAISHTWVGWVAMTDFLLETGAITAEERLQTLRRVDEALHEAGRAAVNPDMPRTTGARARELLAYALRQGIAYVDDVRTGECPPWPLAGRLGWRRTVTETDMMGSPSKYRLERNGIRLGYVMHDPGPKDRGRVLMCESTQLEAVLKAASATQAEKLEIDRNTACRALHDEHVLIPDTSEGRTRHTVKCRIHAEERDARMVTLYLDRVIDDEDDAAGDGPEDGGDFPGGDDPHSGPGNHHPDDGGTAPDTDGEDPVLEIPGLNTPDPHAVDTAHTMTESGTGADTDHRGDRDGTDHPSEETPMDEPELTARPHTDLDGVVGWTEPRSSGDVAPCVVCGVRSGVVISGVRVHTVCWEGSTATDRAAQTPVGHPWKRGQQPDTDVQATTQPEAPAPDPMPAPSPTPAKERTSPTKAAVTETKFRAAAAVVDIDGIWLSNGEFVEMPGDGPQHAGDLVRLAQWLSLGTAVTKYLDAAAQVWVGDDLARRLGIDVEAITKASEQDKDKVARESSATSVAVTAAQEAGYSFGGKGDDALGRWTRIWKGTEKSVWVVLLAAMSRDDANVALMRDQPDHATLARRIGLLADALGHPYQLSGSTTGLDLMTTLRHRDRDRFFPVLEPCPPAQVSNVEADISWCRQPTGERQAHKWIHAYDRSGSYLAGVSGLELGVGAPVHHPDGTAFVPRMPGYWRIEIPDTGDWRMPHPLDPRGLHAGKVRWATTPALEFAAEQGYEPEILEAYTWAERARILDPWYERIRDARTRLDVDDIDSQIARDQLKQIYAPTIGMLGSSTHMAGRVGYAPERRHMIIAKARTNILRRIATIGNETGRYPVAVVADTVLYTSPDPDPVASWPGGERWMGRELGRYKVEGSAPLKEHLEFLTGGTYKGKDAIVERVAGAE